MIDHWNGLDPKALDPETRDAEHTNVDEPKPTNRGQITAEILQEMMLTDLEIHQEKASYETLAKRINRWFGVDEPEPTVTLEPGLIIGPDTNWEWVDEKDRKK